MVLASLILTAVVEIPYDGVDQDGDGVDLVDVDGDGFVGSLALGPDCADLDPDVHPGAPDHPGDLLDTDCGGSDGRDRRWPLRRW